MLYECPWGACIDGKKRIYAYMRIHWDSKPDTHQPRPPRSKVPHSGISCATSSRTLPLLQPNTLDFITQDPISTGKPFVR